MPPSVPASIPAGDPSGASPQRILDVRHAMALCIGMVVGAGIFKTSPMVAQFLATPEQLYLAWALGGVLSFVGGLCFAELAAAFPDAGGDYHFLRRAFGARLGFLFAWSRFAVIHTGSMALLGFVFGDYLAQVVDLSPWLGEYVSAWLAGGLIVALTGLNLLGVRVGLGTQLGLTTLVIGGLLLLGVSAGVQQWQGLAPATPAAPGGGAGALGAVSGATVSWGTAMVFVFLAYGGWSDAATLSAEMKDPRRGIVRALLLGLGTVTALYLLANWAYVRVLGMGGLAASAAPAAESMRVVFGRGAELVMVGVVTLTALSVMNAILIAGPRTTYAAARDLAEEMQLARWDADRGTPTVAVIATSGMALALVAFGAATRGGFSTMVDYLSPVYWCFLTLSGLAVLVLRRKAPAHPRPFRVPLYPVLPLVFVGCSAYVLWSSVVYVSSGAVVGVAVLAAGALLLWSYGRLRRRP
ncbi:APC family permease [Roseateles chitinivorans]|uniref:APC family permease n=1 Tax=Roseateles chitinivorans TaxID=2917965 RepID=UPI003D666436